MMKNPKLEGGLYYRNIVVWPLYLILYQLIYIYLRLSYSGGFRRKL
jgi:hypothetical protein